MPIRLSHRHTTRSMWACSTLTPISTFIIAPRSANLKTWRIGIHHGVSHQHLQAHLNEFVFRFNRRYYPFNAFCSLLAIAGDATSPTYDELYSGEWEYPTFSGSM